MKPGSVAVVGAAESTKIGRVPELSSIGLALDGAINALNDAGIKASDIDGLTTGYLPPADMARYLGIYPRWADNTVVGGCSWMYQVRNAVAAINVGYCNTVLIVYGESGRSHNMKPNSYDINTPASMGQQFDAPYGGETMQAALFSLSLVRYMRDFGLTESDLAEVPVAQRKWAALNPRAKLRDPVSVDDVLNSQVIAWPIRRAMCCLVSDAGGAMVLTAADRVGDFSKKPVYILGTGSAIEAGLVSPAGVRDPLRPELIRVSGRDALESSRLELSDVDHLMVYDAFAHNPWFALEGLGFVNYGEAGDFVREGNTSPGGVLPMNTNGGGLCYAHSGSYGMLCMQECIRQVRGEAHAQVPGVEVSMAHGWGGFWSACATVIFSGIRP